MQKQLKKFNAFINLIQFENVRIIGDLSYEVIIIRLV